MLSHQAALGRIELQANQVRAHWQRDDPQALAQWNPMIRRNTVLVDLFRELSYTATGGGFTVAANGAELATLDLDPDFERRNDDQRLQYWTDVLRSQLTAVDSAMPLRLPRMAEVMSQAQATLPFFAGPAGLQPGRHAPLLELLDLTAGFASLVSQRFKHALNVQRPATLSAAVAPLLATPEHGSLPSGHSTENHAMAHVLSCLLPAWAPSFQATAHRIAENRTVAGVHFPMDSEAGRTLGQALAEFLVHRCTGQSGVDGLTAPSAAKPAFFQRRYVVDATANFLDPSTVAGNATPHQHSQGSNALAKWYWDRAKACLG